MSAWLWALMTMKVILPEIGVPSNDPDAALAILQAFFRVPFASPVV
jgi:hypothetical protein